MSFGGWFSGGAGGGARPTRRSSQRQARFSMRASFPLRHDEQDRPGGRGVLDRGQRRRQPVEQHFELGPGRVVDGAVRDQLAITLNAVEPLLQVIEELPPVAAEFGAQVPDRKAGGVERTSQRVGREHVDVADAVVPAVRKETELAEHRELDVARVGHRDGEPRARLHQAGRLAQRPQRVHGVFERFPQRDNVKEVERRTVFARPDLQSRSKSTRGRTQSKTD